MTGGNVSINRAFEKAHTGLEPHEEDGFVIITAASDSGMVDIHDRRPLLLSPDLANEWLDPEISAARAEEIARDCCRPTEEFEWFKVAWDLGNVRNQGAGLIVPPVSGR